MKYTVVVGNSTNIPAILETNSKECQELIKSDLYRAVYRGNEMSCNLIVMSINFQNNLNEI